MARIHNAYNELREKVEKQANERRDHGIAMRQVRIDETIFHLILLVISIAVLVVVIRNPGIGQSVQGWVQGLADRIQHPIFQLKMPDIFLFRRWLDQAALVTAIGTALDFLLGAAVFVLIAAADLAVFLMALVLPWVSRGAVYILPVLTGIFVIGAIYGNWSTGSYDGYTAMSDEEEILRVGLAGEEKALEAMRQLPDNCHVYSNLHIPHAGGESETDLIVVAPAGITIIEVKNHKGIICGGAGDEQLTKHKSVRGGKSNEKSFYNPIRQVATHAYRLKGFLHKHGVNTFVRTCVLFINDEATVEISGLTEKCPVFEAGQAGALRSFLTTNSRHLLNDDYTKAVNALNELTRKSHAGHSDRGPAALDLELDDLFR